MCGRCCFSQKIWHTWMSSPQPFKIILSYFVQWNLHLCIKVLMNLDCEPSNIVFFFQEISAKTFHQHKISFCFHEIVMRADPIAHKLLFNGDPYTWSSNNTHSVKINKNLLNRTSLKASTHLFLSVTLVRHFEVTSSTRTLNSSLQTLACESTKITPMWCNPHWIFKLMSIGLREQNNSPLRTPKKISKDVKLQWVFFHEITKPDFRQT